MNREIVAYAVDAGGGENMAWVSSLTKERCSHDLNELANAALQHLSSGKKIALGFECVLFLPCPQLVDELGQAREGECTPETENRPFTAPAGACATMTGLPQIAWVLRRMKQERPESTATTRWADFEAGTADIFVWEAFVSGFEKGPSHHADAVLAVDSFEGHRGDMANASRMKAKQPFSLAGSLILWAGLSNDLTLLQHEPVVLRPIVDPATLAENKRHILAGRKQRREQRRKDKGAGDVE